MKRKLSAGTTGIRVWLDQSEALRRIEEQYPDLNFSIAARRGLDLFIAEMTGTPAPPRSHFLQ